MTLAEAALGVLLAATAEEKIAASRRTAAAWRGVKVDGHVDAVLAAIKELG